MSVVQSPETRSLPRIRLHVKRLAEAKAPATRDSSIDTLRGLAIILVVLVHVVGTHSGTGLKLPDSHPLRIFGSSLEFFRMPLFTVLSGWVFANNPGLLDRLGEFYSTKLRRIVLPAATAMGGFLLFRAVAPSGSLDSTDAQPFWQIPFRPYRQFWFVQSLVLIFLVVAPMERQGWLKRERIWLGLTLLAFGGCLLHQDASTLFNLRGALFLLPFFLVGIGLKRFSGRLEGRWVSLGLAAVAGIWLTYQTLHLVRGESIGNVRTSIFPLIAGVAVIALLLKHRFSNSFLTLVGGYSFTIYLYHMIPVKGMDVVLGRLGLTQFAVQIPLAVTIGVLVPIVLHQLAARWTLSKVVVLGLRPSRA
ncbi:acyltransferase [bacterium]|nr:MAG: acyltransferase [bacterium]